MAWRKPENLRDWLRLALRHKKKLFFPAVGVMIAVVLLSFKIPHRRYRAEVRLQRIDDNAMSGPVASAGPAGATPSRPEAQPPGAVEATRRGLVEDLTGRDALE